MIKLQSVLITTGVIVADLCINTAILMVTYPIWRELHYQRYSTSYWIQVYCWAGIFSTVVVLFTSIVSSVIMKSRSVGSTALVQTALSFVALSALAVAADFSEPSPADTWPQIIQHIAAKFFAELQSIKFCALAASSMAITSAMLLCFLLFASARGRNLNER